jgi:hypothetical protein
LALRKITEEQAKERDAAAAEMESASADVRRKERSAVKSAGVGEKLIERIKEASAKRGKTRKARK